MCKSGEPGDEATIMYALGYSSSVVAGMHLGIFPLIYLHVECSYTHYVCELCLRKNEEEEERKMNNKIEVSMPVFLSFCLW